MTVQKIIHDPLSLSQPAAKAAASDRQAAQALLDTLTPVCSTLRLLGAFTLDGTEK